MEVMERIVVVEIAVIVVDIEETMIEEDTEVVATEVIEEMDTVAEVVMNRTPTEEVIAAAMEIVADILRVSDLNILQPEPKNNHMETVAIDLLAWTWAPQNNPEESPNHSIQQKQNSMHYLESPNQMQKKITRI